MRSPLDEAGRRGICRNGDTHAAGGEKEGSAVAIAGDFVVVAREEGKVWLLSSTDLSTVRELTLETRTQPRFVSAVAGRQPLRRPVPEPPPVADRRQNRAGGSSPSVRGQGDIAGFAFAGERLLVADRVNRVTAYDLARPCSRQTFRAADEPCRDRLLLRRSADVHALSQAGRARQHRAVCADRQAHDRPGLFRGDLPQQREDLHPWRPVRSGLVFVGVVLLIACVYIERREF